jgi:hypothetical protein
MVDETLIPRLLAVVERLNAAGDNWGWAGQEIARTAIRRWSSYSRRHKKAKRVTDDARVLDLVKGLQAHFEPDIPYTHPTDWRTLAEALARVLRASNLDR